MNFARILFPTDFSKTAQHALGYARDLAERYDAVVHLLHVVRDPMSQGWAGDAVGVMVPDLLTTWRNDAERRLRELPLGGTRTACAVRVGHPFVEIIRYATDNEIDLIVMGTHGLGPVEQMLLGSVAERVVRKASCPVLTVRRLDHTP